MKGFHSVPLKECTVVEYDVWWELHCADGDAQTWD